MDSFSFLLLLPLLSYPPPLSSPTKVIKALITKVKWHSTEYSVYIHSSNARILPLTLAGKGRVDVVFPSFLDEVQYAARALVPSFPLSFFISSFLSFSKLIP